MQSISNSCVEKKSILITLNSITISGDKYGTFLSDQRLRGGESECGGEEIEVDGPQ